LGTETAFCEASSRPYVEPLSDYEAPNYVVTNVFISLQDFSHVRKLSQSVLTRSKSKPGTAPPPVQSPARPPGKAQRRPDPIIVLSPSASSILRMSNIKSFLDNAVYIPPDHDTAATATTDITHIERRMKTIEEHRPIRFIVVDSTEKFKPDYWNRVVAVFTTGQLWQFRSYKWQAPEELFRHILGVYVGWERDQIPAAVQGWGRGVMTARVSNWSDREGTTNRFKDRAVVEDIWKSIEENMRAKGWTGKSAPTQI
jgi:parafibromin